MSLSYARNWQRISNGRKRLRRAFKIQEASQLACEKAEESGDEAAFDKAFIHYCDTMEDVLRATERWLKVAPPGTRM